MFRAARDLEAELDQLLQALEPAGDYLSFE